MVVFHQRIGRQPTIAGESVFRNKIPETLLDTGRTSPRSVESPGLLKQTDGGESREPWMTPVEARAATQKAKTRRERKAETQRQRRAEGRA